MKHQEIEWVRVVDQIVVAQNRDKWQAIVNVVMNFLVIVPEFGGFVQFKPLRKAVSTCVREGLCLKYLQE
jgi:hypothetical protein